MSSTLQQQLGVIASNSTHQLDLKTQKARHSKSLLFEPRDASTQSFDTIYQICHEGFAELCMLDARFSVFGRNLFSEQSKSEDRTQMTVQENKELDKTIESFLGLIGGRLLLKPALKAVEWLVRRFRVQEYETDVVLFTFLPYHTSNIFSVLLSILPDQLPAKFKFLHPYVASLQSPPRHAVLSTATNNSGFFSAFNQYVLGVAKARHHSAALLGFWASITAQAINGMIDASRSGRDSVRKQREEDLLLQVLPILQSALSVRGVSELYLGSCMIVTILATKASLEDKVLTAMMEAVASSWTAETVEEGLTCLAVLSEEKQRVPQPKAVTKRILRVGSSGYLLEKISKQQRTEKLLLATCLGALDDMESSSDPDQFLLSTLNNKLLSERSTQSFIDTLLLKATDTSTLDSHDPTGARLVAVLEHLLNTEEHAENIQKVARRMQVDLSHLSSGLTIAPPEVDKAQAASSTGRVLLAEAFDDRAKGLNESTDSLPDLDPEHPSFLDPANNERFKRYAKAFEGARSAVSSLQRFLNLPSLQRKSFARNPQLLTFLARVWTSNVSTATSVQALQAAVAEIRGQSDGQSLNMQPLLPYVITALADPVRRVRQAAATLCVALDDKTFSTEAGVWCKDTLYGSPVREIDWLPALDAFKFWKTAILSNIETCVLDPSFTMRIIADILNGSHPTPSHTSQPEHKDLKGSLRTAVCTFFAGHVAATPVLSVKLRLLDILRRIRKPAANAKKEILSQFAKEWVSLLPGEVDSLCSAQNVSRRDIDKAVIDSLSHRSSDELQMIQSLAAGRIGTRTDLSLYAFDRLRKLWPALKIPSQIAAEDVLFDLALDETTTEATQLIQSEALETLRTLSLPTHVAVHLIEKLPNASDLQDPQPLAKKQRTGRAETAQLRVVDPAKLKNAIRRITLALELIEAAKPEQHPQLLKGLFHLLGELHHFKAMTGSQLVYLQGLVIGCLLSLVQGLQSLPSEEIDRSVIRADLIVETVRTTSNTQIHNAALLLMSSLASWAPELVLHSVMPLFTFMSSTLLKQSDDFSAHVTDQTVARIVPPLAASLKKRGKDLVSGASELLLSFTAAFEHVPLHRRLGLFQHLVQTLGPPDSLFAVMAMLIERYSEDTGIASFVSELSNVFSVDTQLSSFRQYLDLVFDGLKPRRGLSDIILSFGEKDAEQIEDSTVTLLQGIAVLMQNDSLRKRIAKELSTDGEETRNVHAVYGRLLEQTMQLTRDLASNDTLKHAADSVLTSLLLLTPTKDFIESSAQLMQTGSDDTRQQVFRALEARVTQSRRGDVTLQQTFIEVLPNCCAFIREDQPIATRHAAITCVDQIVERYGRQDRAAVAEAAQPVARASALGSTDVSLRTISVLCLASMVEVLGDEFIPLLPQVLGTTLDYLEETLDPSSANHHLHDACFAFTTAVLDYLPRMLSAQYLDRALTLAARSVRSENSGEDHTVSANQFCTLVAQKVGAQECFSSIERTWSAVARSSPEAARLYLGMLDHAVKHHSKKTISRNSQTVLKIVLQAFDLRTDLKDHEVRYGDGCHEVYASVNDFALEMTLKLNDATFRPFFIRMVEWAFRDLSESDIEHRTLRASSVYSFALVLFDQLKSIVTSYATFLIESATDLLTTLGKPIDNAEARTLLDLVLQTLSSSFTHDQDDFWQAPSHFDAVVSPLLGQLENAKYRDVNERVVPAICELAAAAASPEHHKTMNTQIMSYMRHEDTRIRLAAVKCERAITAKLNFDWLALLPEMLPFISELQEDDDEDVEEETLRWVKQIEDVTGESLEGMLQ